MKKLIIFLVFTGAIVLPFVAGAQTQPDLVTAVTSKNLAPGSLNGVSGLQATFGFSVKALGGIRYLPADKPFNLRLPNALTGISNPLCSISFKSPYGVKMATDYFGKKYFVIPKGKGLIFNAGIFCPGDKLQAGSYYGIFDSVKYSYALAESAQAKPSSAISSVGQRTTLLPFIHAINCAKTPNSAKNYYQRTQVQGMPKCANQGSCSVSKVTDICADARTLNKYYCNGGFLTSEIRPCENGCASGSCIAKKSLVSKLDDILNSLNQLAIVIGSLGN